MSCLKKKKKTCQQVNKRFKGRLKTNQKTQHLQTTPEASKMAQQVPATKPEDPSLKLGKYMERKNQLPKAVL